MNNHLIPTPIVDKNGKQTTVLRKSSVNTSPPQNHQVLHSTPALSNTQHSPRYGEAGVSMRLMMKALTQTPRLNLTEDEIDKVLSEIRPETVTILDQFSGSRKGAGTQLSLCAENAAKERSAATFNNLALFLPLATEEYAKDQINGFIAGLQAYNDDDEMIDYTTASQDKIDQAQALLKVAFEIDGKHHKVTVVNTVRRLHLSAPNLIELVKSRPHDADLLIAVVKQHPTLPLRSPARIKELESMMDQRIATPLIQGIL